MKERMLPYHQNESSHRFSQEFSHCLRQHDVTFPYDTIHSLFYSKKQAGIIRMGFMQG